MKFLPFIGEKQLKDLGIVDWGYSEESVPTTFNHYEKWTEANLHGPLGYLNDHRKDLRRDIKNLYPEFKSALVFLFSYQETKKWMLENNHHQVAAYSLGFEGEDYHHALKRKLEVIFQELKKQHPTLERFIALDTQPVLERDLAHRAGLGWYGKNSMLISRKEGSYFIIGSLLLNSTLDLETGEVDTDHCGTCTACIDACPTEAINPETRTLISEKCISTFTIEMMKEVSPPEGFDKSRGEIFGCDICQDVCPWNKKPLERVIGQLKIMERLTFLKSWFFEQSKNKTMMLIEKESNRSFKKMFQGTAFDRPGKTGWLKNLRSKL